MRLLNTESLLLEDFPDDDVPRYAILSHKWESDEVLFQDIQSGNASRRRGYMKIEQVCQQATIDELAYVWIDSCCIDKSSSAELSECLNSMYRWYHNAAVCYVYMFDVRSRGTSDTSSKFEHSIWFKRGWTLQELIAPVKVEFYNFNWTKLGTRESLRTLISSITAINIEVLEGADPEDYSIATRMSWASRRSTARIEDTAYCLLGLFGVNMPMIYGEGQRAFIRLQEEILKSSDDHSIFAWKNKSHGYSGLLATSPADFQDCANIIIADNRADSIPYSLTNVGLSIELPLIPWAPETYLGQLDCGEKEKVGSRIGIFLKMLPQRHQYARVTINGEDRKEISSYELRTDGHRKIYVRQRIRGSAEFMEQLHGFWIRTIPRKIHTKQGGLEHCLSAISAWNIWDCENRILKIPTGTSGTAGVLWYSSAEGYSYLKLGFDNMFNPVYNLDGPLWPLGGTACFPDGSKFWTNMNNRWIQNAIKGDRLNGLKDRKKMLGQPLFVSITLETIQKRKIWVVDIFGKEGQYYIDSSSPSRVKHVPGGDSEQGRIRQVQHGNISCNGCHQAICGTRRQCTECSDFDYCSSCFVTASVSHGYHKFKTIEVPIVQDLRL